MSERVLVDGDEIRVGRTRIRVSISGTGTAADGTLPDEDLPLSVDGLESGLPTSAPQVPGAPVIAGYRIVGELGRGGMGVVYRAVAEKDGRAVALKTMLSEGPLDPDRVRQFKREVEVSRQLKHPNVVEVIDVGRAGRSFWVALELVEGMDLAGLARRRGPLSLQEAVPLLMGSAEGLAYAHRAPLTVSLGSGEGYEFRDCTGIVHRDLKPQNILVAIDAQGRPTSAKVADFGLAKSFDTAGLSDMTVAGQVGGTPAYWPREQITHYRYLHPATDVFSFAALWYQVLSGTHVREGFAEMLRKCNEAGRTPGITEFLNVIIRNPVLPIRERQPAIPAAVAEVFDRALTEIDGKYSDEELQGELARLRYKDAGAFRDAIEEALRETGLWQ
jgi:serine/threonine protein kinase